MATKAPDKKLTPPKLTLKQRAFVDAYFGEAKGNGTQAARLAGYKGNDNTLHQVAVENLRKPAIAAEVAQRQAEREAKAELAGSRIRDRYVQIIEFDYLDAFKLDSKGRIVVKRLDRIPKRLRVLIEEIRFDGEKYTIKIMSKSRALDMLAKMDGMLVQKHQVSGPDGGPIEVGVRAEVRYYFPGRGRLRAKET